LLRLLIWFGSSFAVLFKRKKKIKYFFLPGLDSTCLSKIQLVCLKSNLNPRSCHTQVSTQTLPQSCRQSTKIKPKASCFWCIKANTPVFTFSLSFPKLYGSSFINVSWPTVTDSSSIAFLHKVGDIQMFPREMMKLPRPFPFFFLFFSFCIFQFMIEASEPPLITRPHPPLGRNCLEPFFLCLFLSSSRSAVPSFSP